MARLSRCMKEAFWPQPDRDTWEAALDGDLFGPGEVGAGAKWRPATRLAVEVAYGRWLKWLDDRGELDRDASPGSRATRSKVRQYLEWLQAGSHADLSIVRWMSGLGSALRVMEPESEWKFIATAGARLASQAQRKTNYAARRQPAVDILKLGFSLMDGPVQASGDGWTVAGARDYRDGLLIALWICRPIRRKNLVKLDLGIELLKERGEWELRFEGGAMKAKRPFSCLWPKVLQPALELYLEQVRPTLLQTPPDAPAVPGLWVHAGGALRTGAVVAIIRKRTKKRFGQALNPHLARHIVTSEIAEKTPRNFTDSVAILAHASLGPAEKSYNLAGPSRAAAAYAGMIGELCREDVVNLSRRSERAEPDEYS